MRTLGTSEVLTANINAAAVVGTKIATDAVAGTQISILNEEDGDLMWFDGTAWARVAKGTAGQVLQTNGATIPTWVTNKQTMVPIQRITGTGPFQFTGMGSTYRTYKMIGHLLPALDDKELWLRTSADAFGTAADSGASDYGYTFDGALATSLQGRHDALNSEIIIGGLAGATRAVGNDAAEGIELEVQFSGPDSTTRHKLFKFSSAWLDGSGVLATVNGGGGAKFATEAITGVELSFEGAAPASGDVTLYGILNA
jgi:hypothetical protein